MELLDSEQEYNGLQVLVMPSKLEVGGRNLEPSLSPSRNGALPQLQEQGPMEEAAVPVGNVTLLSVGTPGSSPGSLLPRRRE